MEHDRKRNRRADQSVRARRGFGAHDEVTEIPLTHHHNRTQKQEHDLDRQQPCEEDHRLARLSVGVESDVQTVALAQEEDAQNGDNRYDDHQGRTRFPCRPVLKHRGKGCGRGDHGVQDRGHTEEG